MINIELAGNGKDRARVGPEPLAGGHATAPVRAVGDVGQAFRQQNLVPCILAIAILVDPVAPVVSAVDRQLGRHLGHRQNQEDCGNRVSLE